LPATQLAVQQGSADPQANFKTDWDYFAGNQYKK
jgi:hypothetical protein